MESEVHKAKIKLSSNGLVTYTGFHRCKTGIFGLVNLDIDADINVRAYKALKFPSIGIRQKVSVPGIPSPKTDKSQFTYLKISQLPTDKQFRMIIQDYGLNTSIVVGDIDIDGDKIISTVTSDLGSISIFYYPSDIEYTGGIEKWLSIFANSLETLIPSKLGLIVEVLTYIIRECSVYPIEFEKNMIKTILASHEVYFEVLKSNQEDEIKKFLGQKYDEIDVNLMLNLTEFIAENPGIPLINYVSIKSIGLIKLIETFLLLELEDIIRIMRPGIIDVMI